jgi:regulatory protein
MSDTTASQIRIAAMNYLARREHCRSELRNKLSRRFEDADEIERQLDLLVKDGLQSDKRFATAFVRSRIARFQGLARIRQELNRFDLDAGLIESLFADLEEDWQQLAFEALTKKYRDHQLSDRKARDKARQFLYRRGYSSEQAVAAVDQFIRQPDSE